MATSCNYLRGHNKAVLCLCTRQKEPHSPLVFSGSEDGTCRLWDLRTHKSIRCLRNVEDNPVHDICFLSSNTVFTACGCHVLEYDLRRSDIVLRNADSEVLVCSDEINKLDVDSSLKHLAVADDNGEITVIRIADRCTHRKLRNRHTNICTTIRFHPYRPHLFSAGMDSQCFRWDVSNPRQTRQLSFQPPSNVGYPPFMYSLDISEDGTKLAVSMGTLISIHNTSNCLQLSSMNGHTALVSCVHFPVFSPNKNLLTGGNDCFINLWSLEDIADEKSNATAGKKRSTKTKHKSISSSTVHYSSSCSLPLPQKISWSETEKELFSTTQISARLKHKSKPNAFASCLFGSSSIFVADETNTITSYNCETLGYNPGQN